MSGGHGFLPGPLIENDAPVCEICGEDFSEHGHYALYVEETDRERHSLLICLSDAERALREIEKDLAFHQSRGLDGPCDCKTHRALDAYFAAYREVKP